MVQVAMPRTCVVRLLGDFKVDIDEMPIPADAWRHRRGADLVKLLALSPQHRLHKDQVMEALWPELSEHAAAGNLRKSVHYARRAMRTKAAIEVSGDLVVLWPAGPLRVDADEAETMAASALASGVGLVPAAEVLGRELLPGDRYVEWAEARRQRLRRQRLELLRAMRRWDQVLETDPADEAACRALMRAYLDGGDRSSAIRQFQRLREVLRVDLGVAPEPETIALFEEAVAMEGLPQRGTVERVQVLLARGLLHWNQRELDSAQRLADEARTLAAEHHLGRELGEASALLGMVAMAHGRWPELFRREFTAAVRLDRAEGPFVFDAHLCLAEASITGGAGESVGGLARELLPVAADAGSASGQALMSMLVGESELLAGRLSEARDWLTRAAQLYQHVNSETGVAFTVLRLAEIAMVRGDRTEASRQLVAAKKLAARSELGAHLQVRVLEVVLRVAQGPDQCQRVLGESDRLLLRPKEICGPCSIGLRVVATIVCARAGDVTRSRVWLSGAERVAGMWQGGPWQAAVWEARAALRLAEGDRLQAAALLREATGIYSQFGRPLDVARCVAAAGALA
jgi:DNA-binding SARP family transcriptional activator